MIIQVPPKNISMVWQIVAGMLDRVPDYTGDKDMAQTYDDLIASRKQLWVIEEFKAALITEVKDNGTCLLYMVSGTGIEDWQDHVISRIENWARSVGCTNMLAVGRPGWARVGKKYGYEHAFTTVKKEL